MFEKQSPMFDVTLAFVLFRIIYTGRAALTFVTIKQVSGIDWRFAKKMPPFNFKSLSLMKG